MSNLRPDSPFTDAVARAYDSTLVPLIFEPYADDLAARARTLTPEPDSVLEVACGTGVVARALAATLPDTCAISATDLNSAMVRHAESVGTARPVSWRQADAMALPYADASFDAVVCQFGAMFFSDRVAAYREIRRVLIPGGTFLFNVWSSLEDNEFAAVVTGVMNTLYPGDPPVFLARIPHSRGSPTEIEADLEAAGFERSALVRRDDTSAAPSAEFAAIAYCHGTPLRNEIEEREPGGLERATAVTAEALRARYGDGPIEGRISAVVVTAS